MLVVIVVFDLILSLIFCREEDMIGRAALVERKQKSRRHPQVEHARSLDQQR